MRKLWKHLQLTIVMAMLIGMVGPAMPAMAQESAEPPASTPAVADEPVATETIPAEENGEVADPVATTPAEDAGADTDPVETTPGEEIAPETGEADDIVAPTPEETVAPDPMETVEASTPDVAPTEEIVTTSRATLQQVGCGNPPYASPSGSYLSNAIDSVWADPTELDSNWEDFQLYIGWSLKSAANGGDYFTLALPDEIDFDVMYFPLNDGSGNAVACASVVGNTATFVLTDYVEGRGNVRGTANFWAWLDTTNYTEPTTIPVSFGGFGTITFTVPGDYEEPGPTEPDPWAWKSGWFANSDQGYTNGRHALEWMIHLPASDKGFSDVVVSDTAQHNWTFSCSSPWSENGIIWTEADIDFDVECSSEQLTVRIPSIPANLNVELYFYADIEAGAPGPFNNTFSATGFEDGAVGDSHSIVRSGGGGDGQGDTIVTPITPSATDGVCIDGTWTAPTVTATDGNGVTYDVDLNVETGTYTVTATKSDYQEWADLSGTGWTVSTTNPAQAIYTGTVVPNPCASVIPVTPSVTGNVCEGGVYTPPTIVVNDGNGITYTVGQIDMTTGAYTVTASLSGANTWGDLEGTGWEATSATSAVYSGTVNITSCNDVVPVAPSVTGNVCEEGVYTSPAIVFATTEGITYEVTQPVDANGDFVVTATLSDNQAWGQMPEGWTRTSDTVATFIGTVDLNPCDPVIPVAPSVTDAVCTGGALIDPIVTAANTNGITYRIDGDIVAGAAVTVTATLADGYEWGTMPEGWTRVDTTTATFTVDLADIDCTPVIPVAPSITNAVCVGGGLTNPSLTTPVTEGITYSFDQADVVNGGTVVVTATLDNGFAWGEMPEGWTETSATTATFTVELDDVQCTPVVPVTPEIIQAVCTGGELVPPTVTPATTEGLSYELSGGMAPGATVLVTATLADGFAWGEMPEGWTEVNATTATIDLSLADVECEQVIPAAPVVQQAVCIDGGLIDPTVTLQDTNGISYTLDGDIVSGGTVTVTAILGDGVEWGEMPEGWTRVDNTTATIEISLDDIECTPVVPINPSITNAVCIDGGLTAPTLTTPVTEGITYSFNADDVVNGGTFVITATLADGYAWSEMPEGWTRVDATTATWTVVLENVECITVDPGLPVIEDAVCEDGTMRDPELTFPDTPGITYTIEGEQVPGATVTVTATLEDGYAWGEMSGGWTLVDATTATLTHTFNDVICETPADAPDAPKVNALPSTGSGPAATSGATWMLLATSLFLGAAGLISRLRVR